MLLLLVLLLPCIVLHCICRTEPQWSTQAAEYGPDEAFDLANIQPGCTLRCEVGFEVCFAGGLEGL